MRRLWQETRLRVCSGVCGLGERDPPASQARPSPHTSPTEQSAAGRKTHSPNPAESQQQQHRSRRPLTPAPAARGQNRLLGRSTAPGIVGLPRLLRGGETANQHDDWIVKHRSKCFRRLLCSLFSASLFPETGGARPPESHALML